MKILMAVLFFIFITNSAVYADVYYSINTGCDGNELGMGGGIVYDKDGVTPLSSGSMVQYIYAGKNGIPDPLGSRGGVTGDDILLAAKSVGNDNAWEAFKQRPGLFYNGVTGKIAGDEIPVKIYVRAWNSSAISPGAYYGDSQVVLVESSRTLVPAPNDVGIPSFSTNMKY